MTNYKEKKAEGLCNPISNWCHLMHQEDDNQCKHRRNKDGCNSIGVKPMSFRGLPNDDPNEHIANFLEICDTQKYNSVSVDSVRILLFPFSFKDKAKL